MLRFLVILVLLGSVTVTTTSHAIDIRVRGSATLQASAQTESGALVVRGRLSDEHSRGIAQAPITLSATPDVRPPAPCTARSRNSNPLTTGSNGTFCLRLDDAATRGRIRLRFDGNAYFGAARISLDFDQSAQPKIRTRLRFDPVPSLVNLDDARLTLSARIEAADERRYVERGGHRVVLLDARGEPLATTTSRGDGAIHLRIPSSKLAPAGRQTLKLRFKGNETLAACETHATVTKQAAATLTVLQAPTTLRSSGRGQLRVRVDAAGSAVSTGVVELRTKAGQSIATTSLEGGVATLRFRLPPSQTTRFQFELLYKSNVPWILEPPAVALTIEAARQHWSGPLLLFGALCAALTLLLFGWRRSRRTPQQVPESPEGVFLVAASKEPEAAPRWFGRVTDAHDGRPLPGTQIRLLRPAVNESDAELAHTTTDEAGHFDIRLPQAPDHGCRVAAASTGHHPIETALPRPGQLRIRLVTRRRHLLDRFVAWTRRRRPGVATAIMTPEQVRREEPQETPVARWASQIQTAAFGPEEPSSTKVAELTAREPRIGDHRTARSSPSTTEGISPTDGEK